MLCGILKPTAGEAWVAGNNVFQQPENVKKNIGYMSQKFALYHDLSAKENIEFYASLYGLIENKQNRIHELIEYSGLKELEKEHVKNLSGAWRQRLALACAIVHNPPMLFLDEPTAGVDPISRRKFWEMIYTLAGEGVSILATTHYMDEAEYCNTIGLMYNAKLIVNNTPGILKQEMKGVMLEMECDNPVKAKEVLEQMAEITNLAFHGVLLHIQLGEKRNKKVIENVLSNAHIQVIRSDIIQPSLEDVFLSMVSSKDKSMIKDGIS
jgi:ABC-2 type transport system ATP-binding protein